MISPEFEETIKENVALFGLIRARRLAASIEGIVGSPIELHFACVLASMIEGMESTFSIVSSQAEADEVSSFYIWPQCQIGRHRVDFVIGRKTAGRVIVECDGRDFHHVTRDQIERDRARDADLQAAGWKVMRFPGTQIHNDPWRVATEVVVEIDRPFYVSWWQPRMRFQP